MHLTSVDLPAPLSPTSAVTSPGVGGELDVLEHVHRTEALVDVAQFEDRLVGHGSVLPSVWCRCDRVAA